MTNESDDEIPQLVPRGETPVKQNVEVQKHVTGKKLPKESPGPNISYGRKRKVLSTPETPYAGPGKKPKLTEEMKKILSQEERPETDFKKARGQALQFC